MKIEVGNLIRYKARYIGEQFVVVGIRPIFGSKSDKSVKCVSVKTLKQTRWSHSSTIEVLV